MIKDAEYTIFMRKGQEWTYETVFPPSLDPVVTIEHQGPSRTSSTGEYASVTGRAVTVHIPADAPMNEYHIVIKAETSHPTQIARQCVKFVLSEKQEDEN